MALVPSGRVVGLIASSSISVAGALKGKEVSLCQMGAKTENLAGMEGIMQRSQTKSVVRGLAGEGKSLGVNSAMERAGEAGAVLSLDGLKGSRAKGETGLKDQSSAAMSKGEIGLGRGRLVDVKDKAGDRGLGGVSKPIRWWKEGERGLTGESEGTLRPAQRRQ